MGKYDRLISFLEHEERLLKERIVWLKRPDMPPSGITSGDGGPGDRERQRVEAEEKLREIEGHLRDLRWENRAVSA
jgi:hypothetical protein